MEDMDTIAYLGPHLVKDGKETNYSILLIMRLYILP